MGSVIVFFVPGFAWTLVLFHKINNVERIALSIGLSIAGVTLSVIVLNLLLQVRITGTNTLVTIGVITIVPLGVYLAKRLLRRSRLTGEAAPKEE
ncbi:MAG: hypothetical protein A2Y92_01495 [Chloroflexi bacterium RBG_13_57_8]|nr:MAG: hypothetical protein A2Y92_01495 [Chloroflexi bacterium RBG_13_57_8]